jgi:hypothetical protein
MCQVAMEKGLSTLVGFFGADLARELAAEGKHFSYFY